ncbi:Tektin-2 [Dissostichus eleginoides]|uniref:Tektin n=1 Tax=Dissostichus eleginoides TaxID=100907 RepID=A0AAD9ETK0_DISEL|nr:Tektin-2 [Dissostichus eleginoides]
MSALLAKPSLHHSVSEWNSNNQQLSATAEHERYVSNVIRQEGRSLRNETNCKTTCDDADTSRRLSDRAWNVARWKETLETCAQKVDEEMDALTLCKEQTEQALAATSVPLEVSSECLTLRDSRRGFELAHDPVDVQLKNEVELIERVQQVLQQHIEKAFEHLCVLQENRHQLTGDIQNKMDTLDIDMSCLSLTIKSPQISLKTNPIRIPPGSSTPQEWLQFRGHAGVPANEGGMSLTRAQLQNELDTQRRATEFALRKRNHHEEQARNELEWQIKNTEDEIAEMESDIHGLDADLQAKTASLKLAHTRLENRTNRPGMDLCRDEVYIKHTLLHAQCRTHGLNRSSESNSVVQKMKLHHSRMLQDLSRKQEALSLEQRSMTTRTRLTSPSCSDKTPVLLVPLTNSSGRSNLQLLA